MLVELARADGKAAALCALASGLLAAAVAALLVWSTGPPLWDAGCRFDFENPEHR